MLTSARYAVTWCSHGERYTLSHSTARPCLEVARLLDNHPLVTDLEVREIDTGKLIER